MDEQSLSYRALKNSSFSFLGYIFPIVFSIVLTPILVHNLGIVIYGQYILINSIIILLGLLDLGLSTAFIKFLTEYLAKNKSKNIADLVYTNNYLFFIIGLVGLLIMTGIGLAGNAIFNDSAGSAYYIIIFGLAGITFFINTSNSVFALIPRAHQRFEISTKIDLSYLIIYNIIILILVLLHYHLIAILLAQVLCTLIFSFVYRHNAKKILSIAKLKFAWAKAEVTSCYEFGLKTFISSIAGSSLSYLDRLLIPIFLGPAQLTFYSLPGNVTNQTQGITNSLTLTLFPMVTELNSTEAKEKIKDIYTKTIRMITIINAAITAAIIIFAYKILEYWLGAEFALVSTNILIILALTYYIIALSRPLNTFLLGLGKTKFLATWGVIMAILNAILVLTLLNLMGISGAAIAYLISVLPVFFMFYYTEKKYLALTNRLKFYITIYAKLIFTTIIFYFICRFLLLPLTMNLVALIITGPLSIIIYLSIYKIFGFYDQEDWDTIKKFLTMARQKLQPRKSI